jgi:hypothetical protein
MNRQKNQSRQKTPMSYQQRQKRRTQIIIVVFSGFIILSLILSLIVSL